MQSITVGTKSRVSVVDITSEVEQIVRKSRVSEGICYLYVPHTTAGIFVNEHDDPAVVQDIIGMLDVLVPRAGKYNHAEGNSDSHIKATLVGTSVSVPITGGWLGLGRWQGIFFAEFDGPRTRTVQLTVIKS